MDSSLIGLRFAGGPCDFPGLGSETSTPSLTAPGVLPVFAISLKMSAIWCYTILGLYLIISAQMSSIPVLLLFFNLLTDFLISTSVKSRDLPKTLPNHLRRSKEGQGHSLDKEGLWKALPILKEGVYMFLYMHWCVCIDVFVYACMYECMQHICLHYFACVYVCLYVHVYVYMYVCLHVCLYICMPVCICVYNFVCVYMPFYVLMCKYISMHVWKYLCMYACIYVCMQFVSMCACI